MPPYFKAERMKEGALHFKNAFANAMFLVSLNLGNSIAQIKNIAEVDATGRCIN